MKTRPRDKKAGIIILVALIIISLAEVIFRATVIGEAVLTTSNLGEQLAVIALAVTILILTAKGKDRACYICYGAWLAYFVFDQIFELPGLIVLAIGGLSAGTAAPSLFFGWALHVLIEICIIAIGALLAEYMNDGTIYNRAFNGLCITTVLLIAANIAISICGALVEGASFLLDTFHNMYRMAMVFLCTFFAYDSAKHQLKKANLSK